MNFIKRGIFYIGQGYNRYRERNRAIEKRLSGFKKYNS